MTDLTPVPMLRCTLPVAAESFLTFLRAELDSHDRVYLDRADGLSIDTGVGLVTLTRTADAVLLQAAPLTPPDAFVLRQWVIFYLDRFDTSLAERLDWNLPAPVSAHPQNFRLARVTAVTRPVPGFLRLRLEGPGFALFARGGLHLRLLLPPDGRRPVWPGVDAAGRTVWPQGEDKLHDPVYTIRAIDAAAGWLEIDIYHHGRGRTCRWAPDALGAEVGLMGPGGGWLPDARQLLMAGDETALPAMARILAAADPATCGEVLIEIADPSLRQPLPGPEGVRIRWLLRGQAVLEDWVLARLAASGSPAPYLWFAAEDRQATRLRHVIRKRGTPARGHSYIAGYWTDDVAKN